MSLRWVKQLAALAFLSTPSRLPDRFVRRSERR